MATLLSGISAGAHQGLADLVQSKRAERAERREQRRYENELVFRLKSAASAKREREKMFAYQKTRDEIGDQQWAEAMGLRTDQFEETKRSNLAREGMAEASLAETVRSNKAREEDVDLDRVESIRQHTEDIGVRREGMLQDQRQFDATLTQRKQEHLDTLKEGSLARQLTQSRDQTQANYYSEIIRLREQELNKAQTPEERAKILAEIEEIKARTRYYDRRPTTGASGTDLYNPTSTDATSIVEDVASRITERVYKDSEGRGFSLNLWHKVPWHQPPGSKEPALDVLLNQHGADAYRSLLERMPTADIEDTSRLRFMLAQVFDRVMQDNKEMRGDILAGSGAPGTTDLEKLEAARKAFVDGGIHLYLQEKNIDERFKQQTTTPTGERTIGDLDVPGISPRSMHDFRNRGVR